MPAQRRNRAKRKSLDRRPISDISLSETLETPTTPKDKTTKRPTHPPKIEICARFGYLHFGLRDCTPVPGTIYIQAISKVGTSQRFVTRLTEPIETFAHYSILRRRESA